jgi:8-hydroxy-5-deazaflavin:NADPH oxidoreductase
MAETITRRREGTMKIGVLGTGNMGSGFARQFASAGHDVFIGSRDPQRGKEMGAELGIGGGSYQEATDHGDAVVFAVPWWGVDESLAAAGNLSGKVLIDCTNPYKDETYTEMHELPGSSGAEEIATKAEGARVVKAWNHTYAQIIHSSPDFGGVPASVFICGDDASAKEAVAGLAGDIGYDPVDSGPLSSARFLEQCAGLMVFLAYGVGLGPDQALKLVRR